MADEDDKPKKGGKLKWILLILFFLLLLGGGAGAWYYFLSDLPGSRKASETTTDSGNEVKTARPRHTPSLNTAMIEPFLVNLADPLGKRYIKVTFEAELAGPEVAEELIRQKPKIRDSIIMLLSSKSYADLAPAESKIALKTEVANRLNQVLGGAKVTQVFLTDIVIQ